MSSFSSAQSPGPANVYAARFDTLHDADAVRSKLRAIGYDPLEISYINDREKCSFTFDAMGSHVTKAAVEGVAGGAVVGGGVGAAFGAVALGSVVFLGPIGVIAGVAIGGVVGVLLGAGHDSDQALACENAIDAGSLVMSVQAHSGDDDRVRALLGDRVIGTEHDVY